jgi:hypothetical protein
MGKIRGKSPTRDQRNVLMSYGVEDANDWLYVKTEHVSDDGEKRVARNSSKTLYMVFINKNTSEMQRIPII